MTESDDAKTSHYEIRTANAVVNADADHVVIEADAGVLILEHAGNLVAVVPLSQLVYCICTDPAT
jgi:hypothetical protein